MEYDLKQIEILVLEKADKYVFELNEFGIRNIVFECFEYQEEGREVENQLDYIFEEAIPDGSRNEYFE